MSTAIEAKLRKLDPRVPVTITSAPRGLLQIGVMLSTPVTGEVHQPARTRTHPRSGAR